MRWILGVVLLVSVLVPVSLAGDEVQKPSPRGASPEALARIILGEDGPQQNFAAQVLQQSDRSTLLAIQSAIRKQLPDAAKLAATRSPAAPLVTDPTKSVDLVNCEIRLLEVDAGAAFLSELIGTDEADATSSTLKVQYLDDPQLEVILRAAHKSSRIRQIIAPRLTVYDGQHANVSMLDQTRYIESYRIECLSGTTVAQPVLGLVHDGIVIGLRPTTSQDKRYLTLELEGTSASVVKPIRSDQIRLLGRLHPLQRPHTELESWRSTVRIPTGGSILLWGAFTPRGRKGVGLAIVTATAFTAKAGAMLPEVDLTPAEPKAPAGAGAPPRVKRVGK